MSKFCKLSFNLNASHAENDFELLHVDILRPYRFQTRNKHMYFLTIFNDYTRATWVYLMQLKSDAYDMLCMLIKFVMV